MLDSLDWSVVYTYRELILQGLVATVWLSVVCIAASLFIGLVAGLGRVYLPRPLSWIFVLYTEFFRNVPPLVQLFFWYFGAGLDVIPAAILGLSLFGGAYLSEAFRSGILSIPATQTEAARSAGLSMFQTVMRIVLPQAVLRILPIISNQAIGVIKDTSVAMSIGFAELTFQTQSIEAMTFRGFEAVTVATVLYVALACAVVMAIHTLSHLIAAKTRRG